MKRGWRKATYRVEGNHACKRNISFIGLVTSPGWGKSVGTELRCAKKGGCENQSELSIKRNQGGKGGSSRT